MPSTRTSMWTPRSWNASRVECPICGVRRRRFEPAGVVPRPNARCPRCGSYERHRALWLHLEREPLSGRVLHWAPEPALAERLRTRVDYEAADLRGGPGVAALDIQRIDRPDAHYDRILCLHVLEHVPDDAAALRELHRVLKPGGSALLQVPLHEGETDEDPAVTDPAERERRFGQRDHVRRYGLDFADRVRAAGFEVDTLPPLSSELTRRHALVPSGFAGPPEALLLYRARR